MQHNNYICFQELFQSHPSLNGYHSCLASTSTAYLLHYKLFYVPVLKSSEAETVLIDK